MKVICGVCGKTRNVKYHKIYKVKVVRCRSCSQRLRKWSIGYNVKLLLKIKRCTICKRWLRIDNFHSNKSTPDGLSTFCNKCNKERCSKYRSENRDKIKGYAHKSYIKHRDRCLARSKANCKFPYPQVCSISGCGELGERHHSDYSSPLEIVWLCKKHHVYLHSEPSMV